jgi:hypothetical protein
MTGNRDQESGVGNQKRISDEQLKGLHDVAIMRSRKDKETPWMLKS